LPIQIKKGAMFGLDARIALAIFGALSVISGAALYSAIQEANVVQKVSQIKEVEKAIEQYILDTGSMLPFSTTYGAADLSAYALVEKPSGVIGWNGPYLNFEKHASSDYLLNKGDRIAITFSRTEDFSTASNCLRSSNDCAVYTVYVSDTTHNDALEAKLDGNTTADTAGNFRIKWGHQYFKSSIPFDKSTSPNP
jgi:type II secretory pathway pseudopilin PulG